MSCKFSDFDGKCTIFDPEIECMGVSDEGHCICQDDEDPGYSCENYENNEE